MNTILRRSCTLSSALLLLAVPGLSLNAAPDEPLASTGAAKRPARELSTAKPKRAPEPIVTSAFRAEVVMVNIGDEKFSILHEGKVHQFKMAQGGILFHRGRMTSLKSLVVGQDVMVEVLEHPNGRFDLLTASTLPPKKAEKKAASTAQAKTSKESRRLAKAEAKAKKQAEEDAREIAKADAKAQKKAAKEARKQNKIEAERQKEAQQKANKEARKLAKAESKAKKQAEKDARERAEAEAKAQKKADKEARKLEKTEGTAQKEVVTKTKNEPAGQTEP